MGQIEIMKTCKKCNENKTLESFYVRSAAKDGKSPWCSSCTDQFSKDWYKSNKSSHCAQQRVWRMKSLFGLTVEQYDYMYRRQNGLCAICSGVNLDGRRLHVDHNHATGKIRGLLCYRCNSALGYSKDSIEILHKAADYLENHSRIKSMEVT